MDFALELEKMREKFKRDRQGVKLPSPPGWLTSSDKLSLIYENSSKTIKYGEVYYGALVQANNLLFKNIFILDLSSDYNSPANFVYSTAEFLNQDPSIISRLANELFSYKNDYNRPIPDSFREVVVTIRDEHNRSGVQIYLPGFDDAPEPPIVNSVATFVFRPFLPKRRLISSLVPIIACDSCWSWPIILPKKFWSEEFTNAWINGDL